MPHTPNPSASTLDPRPYDVQLSYEALPDPRYRGIKHPWLTQRMNARRTTIEPRTVTVNYYAMGGRVRWYVVVEGPLIRQADSEKASHGRTGRIAYWPENDQEEARIEHAPDWLKAIVADAHRLIEHMGMSA